MNLYIYVLRIVQMLEFTHVYSNCNNRTCTVFPIFIPTNTFDYCGPCHASISSWLWVGFRRLTHYCRILEKCDCGVSLITHTLIFCVYLWGLHWIEQCKYGNSGNAILLTGETISSPVRHKSVVTLVVPLSGYSKIDLCTPLCEW